MLFLVASLFLTCHMRARLQWWAQLFAGLSERVFLVPDADLNKLNNEGIFPQKAVLPGAPFQHQELHSILALRVLLFVGTEHERNSTIMWANSALLWPIFVER